MCTGRTRLFAAMITVISPAKLMDRSIRSDLRGLTQPAFPAEAAALAKGLKALSPSAISKLMTVSPKIAAETAEDYHQWQLPFTPENATPALLLFRGDVYRGLDADSLSKGELDFAQKHLRILSGLYGILRPLDLIQPYRLMMGTPYVPSKSHKNLYSFWGTQLADHLQSEGKEANIIVNLASEEYFRALHVPGLKARVVTCEFKEKKGMKYTVVSTYAKLARGKMTRHILTNKINKPEQLITFNEDGYAFNPSLSAEDRLVFTR
jgi:cytoplasmic iron level regulating protein YaaA (DUF328/UPF0246 family)